MRTAILAFAIVLTISASAFGQSLRIDRPDGTRSVPVPFVVEGTADPGAVLVLEVDGEFVTVFRADSEGRFSVPVSTSASQITVRLKGESAVSASVAIATGGEFQPSTSREETVAEPPPPDALEAADPSAEDEPVRQEESDEEPADTDADTEPPTAAALTAEVPPPPEELEGDVEQTDDDETIPEPGPDQASDLPVGYVEKCHYRPLRSALHCHVVPHESQPSFQPFGLGTMVVQFFGSVIGAGVLAAGGGFLTYAIVRPTANGFDAGSAGIVAGTLLLFPGAALGAWGTGELLGGDGSFLWSLGGTLVLGVVGSVVGYHLSADNVYDDELEQYEGSRQRWGAAPVHGAPLVTVRF